MEPVHVWRFHLEAVPQRPHVVSHEGIHIFNEIPSSPACQTGDSTSPSVLPAFHREISPLAPFGLSVTESSCDSEESSCPGSSSRPPEMANPTACSFCQSPFSGYRARKLRYRKAANYDSSRHSAHYGLEQRRDPPPVSLHNPPGHKR